MRRICALPPPHLEQAALFAACQQHIKQHSFRPPAHQARPELTEHGEIKARIV